MLSMAEEHVLREIKFDNFSELSIGKYYDVVFKYFIWNNYLFRKYVYPEISW